MFVEDAQGLQAIHPWQADIQKDSVRTDVLQNPQSVLRLGLQRAVVSGLGQETGE